MMVRTLPRISEIGTVPCSSSSMCARESAELSSEYEIRALNAERECESCYMAEYMLKFIGQQDTHSLDDGYDRKLGPDLILS